MADPVVADQIPPNPIFTSDFEALPFDPTYFAEDVNLSDNFILYDDDNINLDEILNFDDFESAPLKPISSSDPESGSSDKGVSETELYDACGDHCLSAARASVSRSPESGHVSELTSDIDGYLNVQSLNSQESGCEPSKVPIGLNCSSPETGNLEVSGPASSQGSGNFHSAGSEALSNPSPKPGIDSRSADSSHNSAENLRKDVDQKIKLEEPIKKCLIKRKKENDDLNSELRTHKYRRSNAVENTDESNCLNSTNDDEEKRKARLMRNRESAQLSRQRKKHYVEELEDKVRAMHSTIQDLNAKISFVVAENATLRQQLSSGAVCPPQVPPPPPGIYPHMHMAPMGYPWMPCPPHVVKPQGSQVPLVPIPRLKPQTPVSTTKTKKVESKKTDGKTKKVASVSVLGLLFFMLLFGCLVPMVKVNYGGIIIPFSGGSDYTENLHGRVLTVNGTNHNNKIEFSNEKFVGGRDFKDNSRSNDSEPLVASLYVPRNDKLVKIDGNLIIHSVLASEKAMASRDELKTKSKEETGLTVALAPSISVPGVGRNGRQSHLYRALPSGSASKDDLDSPVGEGKIQQWFREGLAGPLLSSGMCTEVFQFDASPAPGAIIPATAVHNISTEEHLQNSTHLNKMKNRRILHSPSIPLPGTMSHNMTKERTGPNSHKENPLRNNSLTSSSSMIVSVLVDPREAGDSDGVMGPKSLSRIFVVVLLDSVKYVTYSCVLPLMGSSPHLVTT